jgi:hypothetical protein
MQGHARVDGIGLTLLVDREGWARLSLVRLVEGRLTGFDGRISRGTAALLRGRIETTAGILAEAYATTVRRVRAVQPADAPLTVCLHVGTSLVGGQGIWMTMDTFGEGRDRAWLNLGTGREAGTWGDSTVIAVLRPVGEVALARIAALLMADSSAVGPGLGALPEA